MIKSITPVKIKIIDEIIQSQKPKPNPHEDVINIISPFGIITSRDPLPCKLPRLISEILDIPYENAVATNIINKILAVININEKRLLSNTFGIKLIPINTNPE
jgi:hypothetical protein